MDERRKQTCRDVAWLLVQLLENQTEVSRHLDTADLEDRQHDELVDAADDLLAALTPLCDDESADVEWVLLTEGRAERNSND